METSTLSAIIMGIAYGIDIKESEDPYILVAEEAVALAAEAGVPGTYWVDFFPILKHIPSWFPHAGFKTKPARAKALALSMAEKPFRYVKEQLVRDHFIEIPSLCSGDDYFIEKWLGRAIRDSKPH